MIPRVARLGTGFVGAGNYYLHDKRPSADETARPSAEQYLLHDKGGAQTSHRVGFTATRNLPTDDPAKALKIMAWLAANAQSVRKAAVAAEAHAVGMSYDAYVRATNPFRGRKVEKPVYTMSIAWHPTRNKTPTDAQMLAAMDEVIKVLGLQEHQAVIVQHTDTKHPHVHLIVNRVHPKTGKIARLGNDYLKVSRWALEYERRTKLIVCPVRVDNWQKRDAARVRKAEARKTDPKAKGEWVLARDVPRGDHEWFRSVAHLPPEQIRQARAARQERDRDRFRMIAARRTAHVDGILTRTYGLAKGDAEAELDRLVRAEYWRKRRDRHPVALVREPRHLAHALIDVFTARAFFRRRRIKLLDRTIATLGRAIDAARRREQAHQGEMWSRMRQRHAAERRRDEERIAALAHSARGKGTTERGRKVFNWRGGVETARHVPPSEPVLSLSRIHSIVANTAEGLRERGRNALSAITRVIGRGVPADILRTTTVGGWQRPSPPDTKPRHGDPSSITADRSKAANDASKNRLDPAAMADRPRPIEAVDRPVTNALDDREQRGAPMAAASPAERAAFEARRDVKLAELQAAERQRQRRKRLRPRGKVRRLE